MVRLPFALLSDLHANLEATQAVFEDVGRLGVRDVVCLGDIVGYGPDPGPVIDAVRRRARTVVSGNHDYAVVHDAYEVMFNSMARAAIEYTRGTLELRPGGASSRARERWQFLENLATVVEEGPLQFVHGSLRDPLSEYVFGDSHELWNPEQVDALFPRVRWICFAGHTHVPVAIRDDRRCWYPSDLEPVLRLDRDHKYIVNAGSVGQPRDGDARACYAVFEGDAVRYRRVAYDTERTRRKIHAMPALAKRLGDRLRIGR